jgi:signal transduction histidine kinase
MKRLFAYETTANPHGTHDAHDVHNVRAECVRANFSAAPFAVGGMLLAVTVLSAVLWDEVSQTQLFLWWALMLAHVAVRAAQVWMFWRHERATPPPSSIATMRWAAHFAAASSLTGLVWGSAVWLLFPVGSPLHQILLLIVIGIVCTVITLQAAPLYEAYLATVLPIAVLAIAKLLSVGSIYTTYALILGIFLTVLSAFAWLINRVFVTSIRLRYENRNLVEALTARTAALEAANRSKSQFLAAASHDLRQPMHTISLLVASLRRPLDSRAQDRALSGIERSASALSSLLAALLDISQLDAGAVTAAPSRVRLDRLLYRLADEVAPLAEAGGLSLKVRVNDKLRATSILVDGDLLARIVSNLLSNALRYTKRGGVLLTTRPRGEEVVIEVWDTGIGVPAEEEAHIFEEFYQVGNPERDREKGIGLGLAIVKRLSLLINAEISMRSRPGRGSVFRVHLHSSLMPADDTEMRAPAANVAAQNLVGKTILFIDDEADIRNAMKVLLTSWGVISVIASDRVSAQVQAVPDIIVADYRLRGEENGVEAVIALRAYWGRSIPALIVTGDSAPEKIEALTKSGLCFLHKPVDVAALFSALSDALVQHR